MVWPEVHRNVTMRSIGLERDCNCALNLFWVEPIGIMTCYHFLRRIRPGSESLALSLLVHFSLGHHNPPEPLLVAILWLGCILGTLKVPNRLLRMNTLGEIGINSRNLQAKPCTVLVGSL